MLPDRWRMALRLVSYLMRLSRVTSLCTLEGRVSWIRSIIVRFFWTESFVLEEKKVMWNPRVQADDKGAVRGGKAGSTLRSVPRRPKESKIQRLGWVFFFLIDKVSYVVLAGLQLATQTRFSWNSHRHVCLYLLSASTRGMRQQHTWQHYFLFAWLWQKYLIK